MCLWEQESPYFALVVPRQIADSVKPVDYMSHSQYDYIQYLNRIKCYDRLTVSQ